VKHILSVVRASGTVLVAAVLIQSPPTVLADSGLGGGGADRLAESSEPSFRSESDACEPDLQPFDVALMGSHGTGDGALAVAVSNGYAFVADGLCGLQMLDVREPTDPTPVATYDTPGYAQGVAVAGHFAFVADGVGGLQIVDISAPSSPAAAGGCSTGGFAYGVAVSGSYAYIGSGAAGLTVIDVSNPSSPVVVGDYDVCGTAWGVAAAGDFVYVAGGASGLHVIDVSEPWAPVRIASFETRSTALGVTVSDGFAYVACGADGLQIMTVADPHSPVLVARCRAPEFAYGVAMIDTYAYVAGGASGLQVMQARASLSLDDPHPGPPTALSNPAGEGGDDGGDRFNARALGQNSPNPFTSTTSIAFSVQREAHVRLSVFDARGRLVRTLVDETRSPKRYVESWDGTDAGGRRLPAGTYFYRIELPGWSDAKKMTLAR
jgi:hypothetical protein